MCCSVEQQRGVRAAERFVFDLIYNNNNRSKCPPIEVRKRKEYTGRFNTSAAELSQKEIQ